jgi:N-carbamoyl-L-amino-acid hydrolase
MTGSHVDTVPHGGKFDGTAGVLTALEAVRAWNHAGVETERPVEIVVFTEEEGTRFGTGLLGSLVATGQLPIEEALTLEDDDGHTVEEVLDDIGYAGNAEFDPGEASAFVELHVEQGPTLEATDRDVGLVENITGIAHSRVVFTGEANHAGTTSMELRRDAFMGAAEFALDLETAARDHATETAAVGTVGKVDVSPNGTNVVPGEVRLGVDIRDTDEESRQTLVEGARQRGEEIAAERGLDMQWENLLDVPATPMDDEVVTTLEAACEAAGVDAMRMPSGAGHDAMNVARVAPTGMLFVPSEDGISHSPAEHTSPEELAAGARVLERGLRSLADA